MSNPRGKKHIKLVVKHYLNSYLMIFFEVSFSNLLNSEGISYNIVGTCMLVSVKIRTNQTTHPNSQDNDNCPCAFNSLKLISMSQLLELYLMVDHKQRQSPLDGHSPSLLDPLFYKETVSSRSQHISHHPAISDLDHSQTIHP